MCLAPPLVAGQGDGRLVIVKDFLSIRIGRTGEQLGGQRADLRVLAGEEPLPAVRVNLRCGDLAAADAGQQPAVPGGAAQKDVERLRFERGREAGPGAENRLGRALVGNAGQFGEGRRL